MKKILVLVLALVMMLSLTACGSEKIEITTDNWQDYLEIKQVLLNEKQLDEFGEVNSEMAFCYTMLCLKDEYADKTVSEDTDIALTFDAVERCYEYTLDGEKVVKGDPVKREPRSIGETIGHDDYATFVRETDDYLNTEYKKVALLPGLGNTDVVGVLEDIEIERIEGTLVLE